MKPKRLQLVFDGDATQWTPNGHACLLCGMKPELDHDTTTMIRIRVKGDQGTRERAWLCPDCVARAFLQMTRLDLWRYVTGSVVAAIRRHFAKRNERKLGQ